MELTIIIPHYNDTKRLKRLLSTIPDSASIQVLVIDDMSDSFAIEDCSSNVELLVNDSGEKGAGVCRNIGIEKAKGDWLLFADSDDYYTSNAFSCVFNYVNSDSDLIFFSPVSEVENEPTRACTRHSHYQKLVVNFLADEDDAIRYQYEVPWSKMIKRSLVIDNDIRFDDTMVSNDTIFSLKVGHFASNVTAVDDNIYCVVERLGSLTKVETKERSLTRINVAIRFNAHLAEWHKSKYQVSFSRIFLNFYKSVGIICMIKIFALFIFRGYSIIPRSIKLMMLPWKN
ncbi:glycosyltransferase family 2 protein [Vibrio mediterranei]|uniref:Glycosyltransferase 2-like domain-containing protein n=1 Tax=Vibrio mediterranei TaxID=689 RepID=A0AAN1KMC3_9VIBR|nr:glycosyltransferase family 2 protein [Vibrio mediterranei]ASI89218.1 hypothetical protein BSZ05_05025 [Vibrio mediterranei]